MASVKEDCGGGALGKDEDEDCTPESVQNVSKQAGGKKKKPRRKNRGDQCLAERDSHHSAPDDKSQRRLPNTRQYSGRSGHNPTWQNKNEPDRRQFWGGANQESHNPNRNSGGREGRRNNHRNQTAGTGNRRQIFENHWSREDVSHGLKRKELIQGALRVNPKNYEECYIPHPDGSSDIFISGLKDRNRALNTDIVAVQLYPREDWKVMMDEIDGDCGGWMDRLEKLSITGQSAAVVEPSTSRQTSETAQIRSSDSHPGISDNKSNGKTPQNLKKRLTQGAKYMSLRDFVISASRQSSDQGHNREVWEQKIAEVPDHLLLRTGKVVALIEGKHSRAATGHLKLMTDRNRNMALFAPLDHRFPRMMIPMEDCPRDFYERPGDHSTVLFVARLTDWPAHSQMAHGKLARSLGEAGDIEPETEGILIEHDIDSSDFSPKVLDCLPQNLPWTIPDCEFAYRKDLRNYCIFTIDPSTARDLDDALHINELGNGQYEVGVHIADVSFFIQDDTELDQIASDRATSVYMVQKVIPMLPRLLCEELCSLNPAADRLAFSVIWKITQDGKIYDEWFGRSVIRSCVKLSYDHAQGFIDEPDRDWTQKELPTITGNFSVADIMKSVLNLHKIAQNLRRQRFENGALRLDQVKLSFALDKDTGMPNGYYVYQQRESNKLVEEFMLLANMAVSHKIYKSFPDVAVLRRHPAPQTRMIDDLKKMCKSLGIAMDLSNSGTIHQSIKAVSGDGAEDMARVQILTALCSKPMQNARYFCTGCLEDEEMYRHYALNVPLYTHFTSPIRRYPDVMVHRLLGAALGYREVPSLMKGQVQDIAEHCNDKKTNSKRAQELSSELFFAVFVKECGPLEERGMVMGVLTKAFDVLILKLGVIKRVYCDKLPLKEFNYRKDHGRPEIVLIWAATSQHPCEVRQTITIFSVVDCVLSGTDEPLKWNAVVKHPEDRLMENEQED